MPGFKGSIKKGQVASQHHKWTTWVDGKPFITFHEMYTMDEYDAIDPKPDWGNHYHYRVVIDGDEPTELILQRPPTQGATTPSPATPGPQWALPTRFPRSARPRQGSSPISNSALCRCAASCASSVSCQRGSRHHAPQGSGYVVVEQCVHASARRVW